MRTKFAGYYRDGIGQDYANARYYSATAGSFWTPDPGGVKTADPKKPTSWNRFTYVGGDDPVNFLDPRGTDDCPADTCVVVTANPDDPIDQGLGGGSSSRKAPLPADPTMNGLDPNEWFQGGFDDAWGRLFTNPNCASAIGGGKYKQVQVENQLMNEVYTAKDLGVAVGAPNGTYNYSVASVVGNLVTLNGDVFFDPTQVTVLNSDGTTNVVNAVTGFAKAYGLDPSKFTAADFQALFLLHELGHTLGALLPDKDNTPQAALNEIANNKTVIDNCFGNDK